MSTKYTFVSKKKREEAEKLSTILSGIQKYSNAELDKAEKELPLMNETVEEIKLQLRRALQNCSPWYREDKDDIGTYLSRGFSWAEYNGYQRLEDVCVFLETHPDYQIEDEYGSVVSLKDFASLVSGNTCAVRFPSEVSSI